ncbi:hypothetical protein [Halorubrum sp. GN11GM_10-3_MGM]|uniref:hypothetical protein n=1 Tax=Halorubrum sp. GN11GM_10-3_MGM TaxID=2518111 RepID=UPI0010FA4456|nr:hypothetical protein [Halorubrum sp. GN11GM_10-3_MGM]TKX72173.1 hypothetical protein EXE40_04845 [Halorubrum sp. GN11GM_10-3_MGM]
MAYSNHVDDRTAEELLTDLRAELDNADTIADTPLAGHFHSVRTASSDTVQVTAIIRHTSDGDGITVDLRKHEKMSAPNASRLPHDCMATATMKTEVMMESDDYDWLVSSLIEDDLMMMGAL